MNPLLSGALRVVLNGLGLLVTPLPRQLELRLGRVLGIVLYYVDPKRRGIARENMRRCLPDLDESARYRLLRDNYEHYGVLCMELMHMFSPVPGHWRAFLERNVVIENHSEWRKAHERAGSSIVVVSHTANWEMMGLASSRGISIIMAVRRLKPEWLNDWFVARRAESGGRVAYGKRILPALLKSLKDGNAIGLVFDQYAPPPMGLPARFFGINVDTQAAISLLVQRTGAAVVPVTQRRDARGVVRVRFEPEIRLTDEELADPAKATQRVVARVEAAIRAEPSQWLWVHRRFKNVVWPATTPAA